MGVYGKIEEFSGGKEQVQYIEQLEFFFTANAIADSEENAGRRKAILLSVISSKTYSILIAPAKLVDNSYKEIVNALKTHFQQRISVLMMRYKFNMCT